jgi:hypothetical protein
MSRSSSLFAGTTKFWILAATLPFLGGILTTSLVASPAVADTIITYTLEGVTAPSFSDSFSGTITYDATTSRTQNVGSIIVTGSTDPGTYTSFGGDRVPCCRLIAGAVHYGSMACKLIEKTKSV